MKSFIFGMLAIPLALIAAGTVKAAANLEKATFAGGCFRCVERGKECVRQVRFL